MTNRDPQKQAKSDSNDLLAAITVGALATGYLLYDGIRRIAELFSTPGAITVDAPIDGQAITAEVGAGAPATVDSATLVVENVNPISSASLILAIAVAAAGLIAVAVLGVLLCRRLARGLVFDIVNARLMFWISMSLLIAGLGEVWFRNMGLNGVFAALGDEFDGQAGLFLQGIPMYAAAMAAGVLVIVFRRGIRLQKDTDGLV